MAGAHGAHEFLDVEMNASPAGRARNGRCGSLQSPMAQREDTSDALVCGWFGGTQDKLVLTSARHFRTRIPDLGANAQMTDGATQL